MLASAARSGWVALTLISVDSKYLQAFRTADTSGRSYLAPRPFVPVYDVLRYHPPPDNFLDICL